MPSKLLKNEKIANIFDKRFIVIQKDNTTVKEVSKMNTNYTVVMNFSKNYHFFRAIDQTQGKEFYLVSRLQREAVSKTRRYRHGSLYT